MSKNNTETRDISKISGWFLVCLILCTSVANAENWAQLIDPKLRKERVTQLKEEAEQKRDEARARANQQGWPSKWMHGNTVYELTAIEDGRVYVLKTFNSNSRISIAVDQIQSVSPYNLSGNGVSVGVWDGGNIRTTHQELVGRINILESSSVIDHATHVAGTIGAVGIKSTAKGMAPSAIIDSYDFNSDESEMTGRAMSYSGEPGTLAISNHSYGYVCGWDNLSSPVKWYGVWGERESDFFGKYLSDTRGWDAVCYGAPYYLPIKASGNDRNDSAPNEGETFEYYNGGWQTKTYNSSTDPYDDNWDNGGFDTLTPKGCAKNVLTVGAVTDAVYSGTRNISQASMTNFSGWGPTDDGRIKPDLVTNGYSVYSSTAGSDSSYAYYSGTSMATPAASGAAALLTECYKNLFGGEYMLSSTLKAVMIHSCDDLGRPGPDYSYGWGLLNTAKAAEIIRDQAVFSDRSIIIEQDFLRRDSNHVYTMEWSGNEPIRATLCWTDPPGSSQIIMDDRTPRLMNDLDLRIYDSVGTEYMPYVLDVYSPEQNATYGDNTVDNVEQVYISAPTVAGEYTIVVSNKGFVLPDRHQVYSLIITGHDLLPAAVDGLTVSVGPSCGEVELEWPEAADANGYTIYYQEGSGIEPFVPTIDGIPASGTDVWDVNSVTILGLDYNSEYYFAVEAYNDKGVSGLSNIVSANPNANCYMTISGSVETVNGNAIPDALVEALETQETVFTDPNGTYNVSVPLGFGGVTVRVSKNEWQFEPPERFHNGPIIYNVNEQNYLGKRWADFNIDGIVALDDYSVIADWWMVNNCELSQDCDFADLDLSGTVEIQDVILFSEQWLITR